VSIMSVMPALTVYGQETSGELTPTVKWYIENGTLHISGTDTVPTTMMGKKSPWSQAVSQFSAVSIDDGITAVGMNLFIGYKNITSLTVAGSVREIGGSAFNKCKNLTTVELKGAIPPDINMVVFYGTKLAQKKLIVPAGTKATYEADPLWSQFGTIEESSQPADNAATAQENSTATLTEPCAIHLTRTTNFVGGGVSLQVFLNGEEQEKLKNGSTIDLQTDRVKNELLIQQGKNPVVIKRFDATSGGDIKIEFSFFFGALKIVE